jgi:hypothetical protein
MAMNLLYILGEIEKQAKKMIDLPVNQRGSVYEEIQPLIRKLRDLSQGDPTSVIISEKIASLTNHLEAIARKQHYKWALGDLGALSGPHGFGKPSDPEAIH